MDTILQEWWNFNRLTLDQSADCFGVRPFTFNTWLTGSNKPSAWTVFKALVSGPPAVVDVARQMLWRYGDGYNV